LLPIIGIAKSGRYRADMLAGAVETSAAAD
jgi:hypothetical protein